MWCGVWRDGDDSRSFNGVAGVTSLNQQSVQSLPPRAPSSRDASSSSSRRKEGGTGNKLYVVESAGWKEPNTFPGSGGLTSLSTNCVALAMHQQMRASNQPYCTNSKGRPLPTASRLRGQCPVRQDGHFASGEVSCKPANILDRRQCCHLHKHCCPDGQDPAHLAPVYLGFTQIPTCLIDAPIRTKCGADLVERMRCASAQQDFIVTSFALNTGFLHSAVPPFLHSRNPPFPKSSTPKILHYRITLSFLLYSIPRTCFCQSAVTNEDSGMQEVTECRVGNEGSRCGFQNGGFGAKDVGKVA